MCRFEGTHFCVLKETPKGKTLPMGRSAFGLPLKPPQKMGYPPKEGHPPTLFDPQDTDPKHGSAHLSGAGLGDAGGPSRKSLERGAEAARGDLPGLGAKPPDPATWSKRMCPNSTGRCVPKSGSDSFLNGFKGKRKGHHLEKSEILRNDQMETLPMPFLEPWQVDMVLGCGW